MDRRKVDEYVYAGASLAATLCAIPAGIMALTGSRLWPFFLFATLALISLMLVYARQRRPAGLIRRWTPWRLMGAVTATGTVLTTLALGALLVSYAIRGLPLEAADFERTCTDRTPHPRSASLTTDRPVTRVLQDVGSTYSHRPELDLHPVEKDGDLTAVQQVACLRLLGSGNQLSTCQYSKGPGFGAYTVTRYQGRWQLDVREARTGRTLTVRQLDGDKDSPCPPSMFVRSHEDPEDDFSEPSSADIEAALAER